MIERLKCTLHDTKLTRWRIWNQKILNVFLICLVRLLNTITVPKNNYIKKCIAWHFSNKVATLQIKNLLNNFLCFYSARRLSPKKRRRVYSDLERVPKTRWQISRTGKRFSNGRTENNGPNETNRKHPRRNPDQGPPVVVFNDTKKNFRYVYYKQNVFIFT